MVKKGFVRARVNGEILYLEDEINLDKNERHTIEVVVDRLVLKKDDREFETRLNQSVETATELSEGKVIINSNGEDYLYSENYACPYHEDVSIPELTPRLFSFNAPYGACPHCNGLGQNLEIDPNKLIIDKKLSINDGGIYIPGASTRKGWTWAMFQAMCKTFNIDCDIPVKDLSKEKIDIIFNGTDKRYRFDYEGKDFSFHGLREFHGIVKGLEKRHKESFSEAQKEEIENKFMIEKECKYCHGKPRFKRVSRNSQRVRKKT